MAPPSKDQLESNTIRVYQAMDESMHKLHRQIDNDKAREESEDIAKTLISNADLPLALRCRALMLLGCSEKAGYVEWAKEAVRVAELGIAAMGYEREPEQLLLANCKKVLKDAEEDYAERGGYENEDDGEDEDEDGEGEEDEEQDEDEEGEDEEGEREGEEEGELIWDSSVQGSYEPETSGRNIAVDSSIATTAAEQSKLQPSEGK